MRNLQQYLLCLSEVILLGFGHLSAFMLDLSVVGLAPEVNGNPHLLLLIRAVQLWIRTIFN